MRILVTGGAGMVGTKLVQQLARDGSLGERSIEHLLLVDVAEPEQRLTAGFEVETVVADLARTEIARRLVSDRPETIFHLAAVVSGEAEEDFEKGYRVNLDGTRCLLDAIRELDGDYCPRLVFASSIAVFGAPFPDVIGDDFRTLPRTSYGTQKAICELLLSDYSRRGVVDGVGIRLPTISVRPGRPNRAASGFFSNIIREPLNGRVAVLPVPEDLRHWHASPRAAVRFLLHAATMDTGLLGHERCLTMPGVSVTVAGQIEALRSVAGAEAVRLIRPEPDQAVREIVASWPLEFDTTRAHALGFRAEATYEEIIGVYVEDELGGTLPVADP
jgi:nucleoside-diphosphate-sugar epimerase